jgi:cobalt-zinc-cadmium efflux system protein
MAHVERREQQRRLSITLFITVLVMLGEVAGGFLSNSLALLSDAGHMFTDVFALGLSLVASRVSGWLPDRRATFGYQRVGLLAAVINGAGLFVIAVFIFRGAYTRFFEPPVVHYGLMLAFAAVGLAANITMALILRHGHHDLNIKSAWLHVLGDALSSVGVIISGLVIALTGWAYADPLASVLIGVIMLAGGVRVVREATGVFLELAPGSLNVEKIAREICGMPEVMGVHDVHLWSLTHGQFSFSAHVWIHDQKVSQAEDVGRKIREKLSLEGIDHVTLEFECTECERSGIFCELYEEED